MRQEEKVHILAMERISEKTEWEAHPNIVHKLMKEAGHTTAADRRMLERQGVAGEEFMIAKKTMKEDSIVGTDDQTTHEGLLKHLKKAARKGRGPARDGGLMQYPKRMNRLVY